MKITDILLRPVPDHTEARKNKPGFRQYPLRAGNKNDEPLVDISLYGIAGQSYYSRPNGGTGEPVLGVSPTVFLRQSVVERLANINYALRQSDEVTELIGGKVELYVNEGYRSPKLQRQLRKTTFPELIKSQNPELSDEGIAARVDQLIAEPSSKDSPAPHATGGAVDVTLRFAHADLKFIPGSGVTLAAKEADLAAADPDYYEHLSKLSAKDKEIRRNRRIFYWIMKGALSDAETGFVVNPTEWWHWSYGDQLWAEITGAPMAFFAAAPEPE